MGKSLQISKEILHILLIMQSKGTPTLMENTTLTK